MEIADIAEGVINAYKEAMGRCPLDVHRDNLNAGSSFEGEGIDTSKLSCLERLDIGVSFGQAGTIERRYCFGIYRPSLEEVLIYGGPVDESFLVMCSLRGRGENIMGLTSDFMQSLIRAEKAASEYLAGIGEKKLVQKDGLRVERYLIPVV